MAIRIRPGATYNQKEQFQILTDVDQRLEDLERALNAGNYVITNLGDERVRTLDVTTATTEQVAKFIATLIEDLKTVGRLK